jgi:hypothetical protein
MNMEIELTGNKFDANQDAGNIRTFPAIKAALELNREFRRLRDGNGNMEGYR